MPSLDGSVETDRRRSALRVRTETSILFLSALNRVRR